MDATAAFAVTTPFHVAFRTASIVFGTTTRAKALRLGVSRGG